MGICASSSTSRKYKDVKVNISQDTSVGASRFKHSSFNPKAQKRPQNFQDSANKDYPEDSILGQLGRVPNQVVKQSHCKKILLGYSNYVSQETHKITRHGQKSSIESISCLDAPQNRPLRSKCTASCETIKQMIHKIGKSSDDLHTSQIGSHTFDALLDGLNGSESFNSKDELLCSGSQQQKCFLYIHEHGILISVPQLSRNIYRSALLTRRAKQNMSIPDDEAARKSLPDSPNRFGKLAFS